MNMSVRGNHDEGNKTGCELGSSPSSVSHVNLKQDVMSSPDLARGRSSVPLSPLAAPRSLSDHGAHGEVRLPGRTACAGRGASRQVDHSRTEDAYHGAERRDEHSSGQETAHSYSSQDLDDRDEQGQPQEERSGRVRPEPTGSACELQRHHSDHPGVMHQEVLHDDQPIRDGPSGLWNAQRQDLRRSASRSPRLCAMGPDHGKGEQPLRPSLGSTCQLGQSDGGSGRTTSSTARAVGAPATEEVHSQEGQQDISCDELSRLSRQHRLECQHPEDAASSPRRSGQLEGRASSQESGEGRRHDHRILRCSEPVDEDEDEVSRGHDCTGNDIFQAGMSGAWEVLPDTKSKQLAYRAQRMIPEAFDSMVSSGRIRLLEIACAHDSVLTASMNRASKSEMSAKRCSLYNGYDLSTNDGIHRVIREIDQEKPQHVWMSPICGPFSVMQNINQRTEQQTLDLQQKRREALKQYVGCALIFTYCARRGTHVTWEWSQSCQAWRLPLVQNLVKQFNPHFAVVRGCRVGLVDENKDVISKGWKLMTTHALLAKRMNMPCQCPPGTLHRKCEGSVTPKTAFYTPQFAKRVCDAIIQGYEEAELIDELRGRTTLPELFGTGGSCVCHQGKHHEANLTCGECCHVQQQSMVGANPKHGTGHDHQHVGCSQKHTPGSHACAAEGSHEVAVPPPNGDEPPNGAVDNIGDVPPNMSDEKIKQKLYLLHAATGHGPIRHMLQALRRHGASEDVMRVANSFQCPVCQERQRPKPRPLSSFEPLPPKWSTIAADMGTWEHPQTGKVYQFLLVIDEGSRFRVGRILGEGKKYHVGASQFIETFGECWTQYFGLPHTLRVDPDGTFRSKNIEDYCDRHSIYLDIIPGEAHWKLGVCANAIKGVKELMTRLALDDPDLSPTVAISESVRVFNEREHVRGYSPIQHALGRSLDPCDRAFPSAVADCPELLVEHASGEMHRNLHRMKIAEQAFLDWNSDQRIMRAKHSRARALQHFEPGDLVYVWRKQVSGQSPTKGGGFVGPARLLALEQTESSDGTRKTSSSAWCVRGRRLWKCSTEQLRKASSKEQLLSELQRSSEPDTWDFKNLVSSLGKNEYLDITEETPSEEEWREGHEPALTWRPVHRHRGKRAASPGVEEMELPPMLEPVNSGPSSSSRPPRAHRSRSPRNPDQALHGQDDYGLKPAPKWWETTEIQSSFLTTECAFWSQPTAAVEIEVSLPTTRASSERAVADFPAFFVGNLKRRSAVEIHEKHLTEEEKAQFRQAKTVEVNNFIASKAFESLPDHLKPSKDQAIRMRWILTWKYKEDGSKKAKARAVLLGYQDPCHEQRATNSPTTTRQSRQLQLQVAASFGFRLRKGDVTGAFLQSRPYPGELYCIPTPEICQAMQLAPESITRVQKACYGLVDAPLEWYRSICAFLESQGVKRTWADPCCWTYHEGSELQGIITAHVDDFLFSGNEKHEGWNKVLSAIKEKYKWSDWEEKKFVQCGVLIEQMDDCSFHLSQEKYVSDLKYINLRAYRKKDRQSSTDDWEKTQLRALLGGVSWHAQQVAPHFSADVGVLLSEVNKSTIDTIYKANKLLDKVKSMKDHKMKIHVVPKEELSMYVWVDAGSQNRPDGSSTQGILLGVASNRLLKGEVCPISFISWHSQKIDRQCRSPGAAEALAAVNGEDALYYGRFQLAELLGHSVQVRAIDSTVNMISGSLVTDSRNVFDKLETETLNIRGAEKRTDLELLSLKAAQNRNRVTIRWVHGEAQLSNGLTKGGEYKQFELFYSMGHQWRLVEDVERASARRRKELGLPPLAHRSAEEKGSMTMETKLDANI